MRAFSMAFRGLKDIVAGSIRASSEFNDAFIKSTAIMGDLSRAMRDDMTQAAEQVAKTTTFSAKEAAEAYFFLASAGMDAAQSINAMPQVAQFAQAGTFDLATATDLLTDAQSALGMTIRDDVIKNMENMGRVSDVLVKANTVANASVAQFSEALTTKAGASLRQWHKDVEEGVAVLAVFADQGRKGAEAGTGLSIVLRDLSTKAIKNADAFKEYGLAVFDSNEKMRNIADIVADLEGVLGDMSDAQAKATLLQLGFSDKSVVFIQSLIGMSDQIKRYEEELRKAGGTTELVAGKQMQSFAAQVKLVQNNWELLLKTLGDFITQGKIGKEILGFLIDVLVRITDSLIENREQWVKMVGGGMNLALVALDAMLTASGLFIAGLAKLGRALIWVQSLMTFGAANKWLEDMDEMARQMEAFGEGLLRGATEVDLLQEKIEMATKIQLGQVEAEKKASAQTLKFRQALVGLRDTLDDVGEKTTGVVTPVKEMVMAFEGFSGPVQNAVDSINEFATEFEKPILKAKTFAELNEEAMKKASKLLEDYGPKLSDATDRQDKLNEQADLFGEIMQQNANLVIIFGQSIGGLVASLSGAASGFKSLFGKGLSGFKDMFKGQTGFSAGSFLGGFAKALPAIGAIAGPIVSLFGKLFKPKWKKLAEESAKIFGQKLSEGLAMELLKTAKRLGSIENAYSAQIGDIVQEVGINAQNASKVLGSFHQMIGMVENGTMQWGEAVEQVDKAFPALAEHLEKLGTKGDFAIGKMVSRMRELGDVSGEVQDFIRERAQSAIGHLSKYFGFLIEQENLTGEQAKNAVAVMAGAFEAAVAATGSLSGAMGMLGEDFGELLGKMRATLGDNNALLNTMTRFYNFVANNEEQLGAIEALGSAFGELAQLGIVNATNVNEYAAAFKDQFDLLLAKTEDQTTALAAMGPQIGMLLESYRELGVTVPQWLTELATKAKEAGASLAPPEGLPDILKDIRDIMLDIAEALGAASRNADDFGSALGGIRPPELSGGFDREFPGGMDGASAQGGMFKKLKRDTLILAHAGELAAILPKEMANKQIEFATARMGYYDDDRIRHRTGGGGGLRLPADGGVPAPGGGSGGGYIEDGGGGPTEEDVEEIASRVVREAAAEFAKAVKPDINIASAPQISVQLPEMTTARAAEMTRDVLIPDFKRAIRNDEQALLTTIKEALGL
jgi:TP901 family phage tail tape measure protein